MLSILTPWIRWTAKAVVLGLGITALVSSSAMAAKPPSNAQLFEMVKALQLRVAVLEEQNGKYQRELIEVRKGAEPARLQLASLTRSADEPKPMRLANPTADALQPADNWSGMYWGASFGVGETKGSHSGVWTSSTPPLIMEAGEDNNIGAVADLFIGFNSRIGSRLVGGVQLEGSMASLNFDAEGATSGPNPRNYTSPRRCNMDDFGLGEGWMAHQTKHHALRSRWTDLRSF
jgi:hypothetical protein